MEEKNFRKTLRKKVKLLRMSNFTFFHNVFFVICILKSFNNHISVAVGGFFEFGTVSKWYIGEWVKWPCTEVSLTETNQSAKQDQPARMCTLVLFYTLRKTNARLRMVEYQLTRSKRSPCFLHVLSTSPLKTL